MIANKKMVVLAASALSAVLACYASAEIIVSYTVDAGGTNPYGPSGLAAQGTFDINGTMLTVILQNTSTGLPLEAMAADSLLVSVGFNLPTGVTIVSGDAADISPGSIGIGLWDGMGAGESVAEEWLWCNSYGGNGLHDYMQVISTSQGQNAPPTYAFVTNALNPLVNGPYGGMAADPVLFPIAATRPAVSSSITFQLTLSETLTMAQLEAMANASRVEFGSDYQYLDVPAPGALALLGLAGLAAGRRRRH